jgi:hypothetical protein
MFLLTQEQSLGGGIIKPILILRTEASERSESHPGHFTSGKRLVFFIQKPGWAPGPVWRATKNLGPLPPAPSGIRSPLCPRGIDSLYRLRYPGLE